MGPLLINIRVRRFLYGFKATHYDYKYEFNITFNDMARKIDVLVYVRFYKIIALTYCQGRCSSLPPVVAVARCRVRMAPANYCIILTCGVFLRLNCVLYVYVSTRSHSRYHILLFRFYKFEDVGSFV